MKSPLKMMLIPALLLLAAGLVLVPALRAQEEPDFDEPDFEEPELTAEPEAAEARPFRPAVLEGEPLRTILDFDRWVEMSYRERQTFVEGAVLTLSAVSQEIKTDLAVTGRMPAENLSAVVKAENLSAVVKFIHNHHPKLPPGDYMQEMDRVYLTAEGQNLSIMECFQLAFRRLNSR
jgi:hypothetical protein